MPFCMSLKPAGACLRFVTARVVLASDASIRHGRPQSIYEETVAGLLTSFFRREAEAKTAFLWQLMHVPMRTLRSYRPKASAY